MRTIAEVEPPLMSAAAEPGRGAALRGDLDRIVEKALRKAPGSRYGTVAELAADLRAWREGRPISAVPHSLLYRVRRAAARHRGAAISVAAVTVALVAGGAATAWQARAAARERDKAQHRFREVRQFSRSLLFDVHDALRTVPGATEPRRLLLDRAVLLLQGLAADAGDDPELQLELGEGYRRLATVQGSAGADNVGDTAAALVSFERAAHWIEEALRRAPDSRDALSTAIDTYGGWAGVAQDRGDLAARDRADARRLVLIDELRRRHPDDEEAIADVASGYSDAGILRAGRRELPEARRFYVQAVDHYARLSPERRAGAAARAYSLTLKRLGAVEMVEDDLDASEGHYRHALAIEEAMNARPGEAGRWNYEITYTLSDLGLIASRRGRLDEALSLWARALEIRQAALAADPRNERVLTGVATLLGRLGYAYRERKAHDAAVEVLERQLALRETALAIPGAPPSRRRERAATAIELAAGLLDRAASRPSSAAEDRRRARAVLQHVAADVETLTGPEGDALRATHREATGRLGG
jgi:tetratricopeptide (TPR) repeat protein